MENSATNNSTEEIVIVGSRYGELAYVVNPLYEKGEPIKRKDIKKVLGGDEVLIYPEDNDFDKFSVGVYTRTHRLLGHVWSSQSPSIMEWLKENKRDYVKGRIHEIITENGLMVAMIDTPLQLGKSMRTNKWDGYEWADDLPDELTNKGSRSLKVCIELLKDELREAKEWNEELQFRIDSLLKILSQDLSPRCMDEERVLFNMMSTSAIKEVRARSYMVANAFVKRGSKEYMKWWVSECLPQFLKESAEGDLMGLFEADTYDLERVEETLKLAPERLFHLYKVNKSRFARTLYYSGLPESLYTRLLTLLAVWERMNSDNHNDNENLNYNQNDNQVVIDKKVLRKAVSKVKQYMWATSAYAVLFCVCRDRYGYPDNMSQFEREFDDDRNLKCPAGTIVSAFRYNTYMKLNVDKWKENGVKERALILKDRFIEVMDKIISQKLS